jgi:putative phosphoesterase
VKIGIVSDTHRNTDLLADAVEWLGRRHGIATLYHLGDDYEDLGGLAESQLEIVQVPGIYHNGYRDGSIPPRAFETVLGLRILLLHSTEKDLTDEDRHSADVVLYGHTHRPEMHIDQGRLYMNPGHLKAAIDKQTPASFGLLDVQDKAVQASIFNLKHEVMEQMQLVRSENGLYRAT